MKRVLIIAHLNPSYGSFRPVPLAKHLSGFGWEPIILTPSLYDKPNSPFPFRVIETPYRDILALTLVKKIFRLNSTVAIGLQAREQFGIRSKRSPIDFVLRMGSEVLAYPDLCRGWTPFALKAGEELMQRENVDAMLSSSNPITSALVASEIRAKYGVPWIADFCDLWSQNHDYHYSPIRRLLDRRLELKTLAKADALITVSEPWAEKLRTLHKGKPVYSITHGFSPDEVNVPPADLTAKFTITYTGTIYTGKQDPAKLFAALRDLTLDGTMNPEDIEVRFYGTGAVWLDEGIRRYGLSNIVKHYERVPKEVSLEKQRESQLLLLLDWDDPEEKGLYLGKIYEYLGTRRPVLATGGSEGDVIDELLIKTKAGVHAMNVPDIKEALTHLYQEYKDKGKVAYNGIESEVNKHSHREMARQFSGVLDQIVRRRLAV